MSIQDPGTRPTEWGTIGDHDSRIRKLEAEPCCFNSNIPSSSFSHLVLTNPCLYAYWPLNDPSGGAADASGNGHDLVENPAGATFGQPVGTQGAYSFTYGLAGPFPAVPAATSIRFEGDDTTNSNGTILYSTLPTGNPFGGSWSVIGWVYLNAQLTNNAPWSNYGGGVFSQGIGFSTAFSNHAFVAIDNGGPTGFAQSTTAVATGSWYFITASYNAVTDVLSIYVDGVLEGTDSVGGTLINPLPTFRLGAQGQGASGPSGFFNGRLSQWALFDCALSDGDIAALAAATGSGSAAAESGMVATADGFGGYIWEFPTIEVQENGV